MNNETGLSPDMQVAADVLSMQRNMAMNEIVNLNIIIKRLEKKVADLTKIVEEVAPEKLK